MTERTARDIMTSPAVTVSRTTSLEEAADTMLDREVGSLVVVEESGKAVGIVTDSDFSARPASIPFSTFRSRELLAQWLGKQNAEEIYDEARELNVEEIMTTPLHSVELSGSLDRVLEIMLDQDVKHVPVLDEGGRPVGMVARHDLLKMLASSRGLMVL